MKKNLIPKKRWSIMIDAVVAKQVEHNLQDPMKPGARDYGALSALVERLLIQWLETSGFDDLPPLEGI